LKYNASYEDIFKMIRDRYQEIKDNCGLMVDLDAEFAEIRSHMRKGMSVDYLVSRGEYLNAKLMAAYLGYDFVDAKDVIRFGQNGKVDRKATEALFKEVFAEHDRIVLPGFYGALPGGAIRTFSRGGSDVTGAIAAASLDADLYENWTDVTGILMADPRIVDNPQTMSTVTYAELRELSYMGASVLHEDTVFPVRRKNIPLNIRNVNEPDAAGTIIKEEFSEEETPKYITGVTGLRNYSIINVYGTNMSKSTETLRRVLEICEDFQVSVEQIPSGADSFSLVIRTESLNGQKYELISAIKNDMDYLDIKVTEGISLIAIVGRGMAYRVGISSMFFGALGENNINIRTIQQSSDEISIIVGVYDEDFEKAIRVLYERFAK
jgi:aspartate kinase